MKGILTPRRLLMYLIPVLLVTAAPTHANEAFSGTWVTNPELSTALDPFRRVILEIEVDGPKITLTEKYDAGRRNNTEVYPLSTAVDVNVVPITWWSANRHIGAYIGGDKTMRIEADWIDGGRTLVLKSNFVLETSQSETPVRTYAEYRLSRDGTRLTRLELRSSRDLPIVHVYERQ